MDCLRQRLSLREKKVVSDDRILKKLILTVLA